MPRKISKYDYSSDHKEQSIKLDIQSRGFIISELTPEIVEIKNDFIARLNSPTSIATENFAKIVKKAACSHNLTLIFPWNFDPKNEYDFCKLCCIVDIIHRLEENRGYLCSNIRLGYDPAILKKCDEFLQNGNLEGLIPKDKKGRYTLDKVCEGFDYCLKLFGMYWTKNITKCMCCGCINGVKYKCSRCESMNYCSRICQETHWNVHKNICKRIKPKKSKVENP